MIYIFDVDKEEEGIFQVKHSLPYSDLESLSVEDKQRYQYLGWPLEFSHTLEDQIGGQIEAGFTINGFYEDHQPRRPLSEIMPLYMATRAVKL